MIKDAGDERSESAARKVASAVEGYLELLKITNADAVSSFDFVFDFGSKVVSVKLTLKAEEQAPF